MEEEEYLLPRLIGVGYNEASFREVAEEYWANFTHPIGLEGVVLNASYTIQNGKKYPVVINDYILANMMLTDDNVTKNEDENYGFKYKLIDLEAAEVRATEAFKAKKTANVFLATYLADETEQRTKELRDVLVFFKKKDGNNVLSINDIDKLTRIKVEEYITQFAETQSEQFMKICQNKSLSTRAFIRRLVEADVIEQVGNVYYDNGDSLGEAVEFVARLQGDDALMGRYMDKIKAKNN